MTHGISMIESMNNLLISLEQMLVLGQEMYERQTRPLKVLFTSTDSPTKMGRVRDAIKAAGGEWDGYLVLARTDIADTDTFTISPSLKPQEWIDTLLDQIFMATATTKHMLGIAP